jgi:prepilin peptidase CpaA
MSTIWWVNAIVLVTASGIDVRTRRIPNWLTVPFLVSGAAVQFATAGWRGLGSSLAGLALAAVLLGIPCFLGGMGMGDLKLAAGVGAWIGPNQAVMAFILTAIAGGLIAGVKAVQQSIAARSPQNAGLAMASEGGVAAEAPGGTRRQSIPYAPAIAIGTLLSFFSA